MPLTSAIIDRRSTDALLALAHKEGLLWAKDETDRVFERICEQQYPAGLHEQLLEQLVLTPKLSTCGLSNSFWNALEGPFKERHLANLDEPESDDVLIQPLPVEMISGLMGQEVTQEQMHELVTRVHASYAEEEQYQAATGKKVPNIAQEEMNRVFERTIFRGHKLQSNYTPEELDSQRRRNEIYGQYSPFFEAMREYAGLAKVGRQFGLLVRTPIYAASVPGPTLTPSFDASAIDAEVAIFRIVAHQLGRTTFRPSLKGSLELANESATASLREMMPYWYTRLAEGDEAELRRLQSEINEASTALNSLSGVRTLGKITTWLALPISAIEMLANLPPILSTSVSLAGFLSWRKDDLVSRKYHWASYGGT